MIIEKLNTKNWHHFEQLFQTCEACQECWCLNHRVKPEEVVTGTQAKEKMKSLTEENKVGGLLAFENEKCVAWISVDPLETQVGHDYVLEKGAEEGAWTIHCIYIAPEYRGKGLAKTLTEKAIEHAKANGAKRILAFPIPPETKHKFPPNDAEFSGRHSTYKKAGFKDREKLNDFYLVMELRS